MSKKEPVTTEALDIVELEEELQRERVRISNKSLIIGLLSALAAIAVLVTIIVNVFPVYRVHGSSMEPTVYAGDTIVCVRGGYDVGDVAAIDFEGKILIKRLVAKGGDRVEIDENGTVYINGEPCGEAYITASGTDIGIIPPPLQVPDGEWYILGDNRTISGDSRLSEIGTVDDKYIIGKVLFRLFPLSKMGSIG